VFKGLTQGGANIGRVFPKYLKALLGNIFYRIIYQAKGHVAF
jgi:hypothetical protein